MKTSWGKGNQIFYILIFKMQSKPVIEKTTKNAKLSADEYPEVKHNLQKEIDGHDCPSRQKRLNKALERTDQIETVLNHEGFLIKRVTVTWKDPVPTSFTDVLSINVAGMKWYPKEITYLTFVS